MSSISLIPVRWVSPRFSRVRGAQPISVAVAKLAEHLGVTGDVTLLRNLRPGVVVAVVDGSLLIVQSNSKNCSWLQHKHPSIFKALTKASSLWQVEEISREGQFEESVSL